jgi:predicted lipoprotein
LKTTLTTLETDPSNASHKEASQQAWLAAMRTWQMLELMQVGPAGSSLKEVIGAQDIRDEIYSWPTVNSCRIDQKTADGSWADSTFFEDNLVNAYGLDALEHLLFGEYTTNCPTIVPPVSNGTWDALGNEGIDKNRVEFAQAVIAEIVSQTNVLVGVWSADDGNLSGNLLPGENSPYETELQALNEIYNAMFYLEVNTKDKKMAIPLGYKECDEEVCVDYLENLESQSSLESLIANLEGYRMIFTGGEQNGFEELLTELGHGDLATQIVMNIDATIDLAESFDQPLDVALVDDFAAVEELYTSLALVTTALKLDMATILEMEVPKEASGDND